MYKKINDRVDKTKRTCIKKILKKIIYPNRNDRVTKLKDRVQRIEKINRLDLAIKSKRSCIKYITCMYC